MKPSALESLLKTIPIGALAIGVSVLAAIKQGILWPQIVVWENQSGLAPEPTAEALSYGYRIVGYLLGFTMEAEYLVLGALVSLLAVAAITFAAWKRVDGGPNKKFVIIILLSGPLVWTLSANLGRVDALLILGSALLVSQKQAGVGAILAAGVMLLAHPEQAIVACTALLLLTIGPRFRQFRPIALSALVTTVVGYLMLIAWSTMLGVSTRPSQFLDLFGASLGRFFTFFPLELYAGLGSALFIIAVVLLWGRSTRNRWSVLLGCIVLPTLVTAVTLDQSRVFVGVSSAAVILLTITYAPDIARLAEHITRQPLTLVFIITLLLPAIHISFTGDLVPPWRDLYYWLIYR